MLNKLRTSKHLILLLLLISILVTVGCSSSTSEDTLTDVSQQSKLQVNISLPQQLSTQGIGDQIQVSKLKIILKDKDDNELKSKVIEEVTSTQVTTAFDKLQTGQKYYVRVEGIEEKNDQQYLIYVGENSKKIVKDVETAKVNINLEYEPGDLKVTTVVPEKTKIAAGKVMLLNPGTQKVEKTKNLVLNNQSQKLETLFNDLKTNVWTIKVELYNSSQEVVATGTRVALAVLPGRSRVTIANFTALHVEDGGSLEVDVNWEQAPQDPQGLEVDSANSQVDLEWETSADSNVHYLVYRSNSKNSSKKLLNQDLISRSSYADTSVQVGESYYYWVQSYNSKTELASELTGSQAVEVKAGGEDNSTNQIVILHTNDMHGKIDNFAKLAAQVKKAEKEYGSGNVFVMSAGDMFSGDAVVDQYDIISGQENKKGYPMIDLMNQVAYDITVIGNHEFDYGQATLNKRIEQAEFPTVCANLDTSQAELKQPAPYKILETKQGVKIGVLGLIQVDENGIPATHPDKVSSIDFLDEFATAQEYSDLAEQSDVVVALSHLGNGKDKQLAQEMNVLDVIIGGHSHTVIANPETTNGVLITQAGGDGKYVGKIVITLKNEQITKREAELVNLNEVTETDAEVQSQVDDYNAEKKEVFNTAIATALNPIDGKQELGSLMTDAVTAEYNLDFAFQNNGGIRVSSLEGEITIGDVYELDPFGNQVVKFELTTAEIKSLIEYSYQKDGGIDLQVSGLKYTVQVNDLGAITGVKLTDYQGQSLDANQTYTVGLNSYIASSYQFEHEDEGTSLQITSANTLINYLKEQNTIDYDGVEDRTATESVEGGIGTTIAHTTVELNAQNKYSASTTAGNLMAEAVKEVAGVDIGTYTSKNLSSGSITAGPIYQEALGSLYTSFNYENKIDKITVTGEDIEAMILAQSQYYGGAALQVAGMSYELIKDAEGEIAAIKAYVAGERIDLNKEYKIGINGYYSQYYKEAAGEVIASNLTTQTEEEILVEYLTGLENKGLKVDAAVTKDRIEIVE
mgnify:FL=1